MLTEKQMKMKLSEIAREKMNEGLYLSFSHVMSFEYRVMLKLEDKNCNEYGLALKIVNAKSLLDPDKAIIQYGKLKKDSLFDFEDEENATVEEFYLYENKYFDEQEGKKLKDRIDYKRKFNPYTNNCHRFSVKSLNIKGLKRTKAKIEIERRNYGYTILKDNKEVKQVNFA